MRPTRRFLWALGAILVVAFALRTAYTLAVTRHDTDLYDQTYYELQARDIAQAHKLFDDPFVHYSDPSKDTPAADHPPLTVVAFLPAALIGDADNAALAMRFTTVLFGVAAVALIALLGRDVGGETVGLLAAAIAAVDPNLWMNDGLIMSESLAVLLTTAIVLVSYRTVRDGTTLRRAIELGGLVALVTLTRAELGLLLPFLVAPALWVGARRGTEAQWRALVASVAVLGLVLAPWIAFNLTRFEDPVLISTGDGLALRGANCDLSYYGADIGSTEMFRCPSSGVGIEQSVWNTQNRDDALSYMGDHLSRLPVVALARVGRAWGVVNVNQTNEIASHEGRPVWASRLGLLAEAAVLALAVVGGLAMRRRGQPLWVLLMPIVVTTLAIALLAAGLERYRAPAEPGLIVLAAVGAMALRTRRARPVAAA